MNLLFNPPLLIKIAKDYLSDMDRLTRYSFDKIDEYRNNAFRKLIQYAYTVPIYRDKYKKAEVKIQDIKSIEDIVKLPIVHREDLIKSYPHGLIPPVPRRDRILVNTSGSTRNPVKLYMDQYILMRSLILYVRELKYYGMRWNKSRISIIGNFYQQTALTRYFASGAEPSLKPFFSFKNIQLLNADDDLKEMIKRLDDFKPEFIIGFPGPLRHLALLKKEGYGKNVEPRCIVSSGGLIDRYEKKNIEKIFGARVFDIYGSTEAGPISFECEKGNFHINSDAVYLEVVNRDGEILEKGKKGKLVITRLYGRGTPIIRYTGMGDIITLKEGSCSCGLQTELLAKVHGRIKETLVLPDKKLVLPDELADVPGKVMLELKTDKIDRIQIVQRSLSKIDVLVIINQDKRNKGASVEKLFEGLKREYQKLFGSKVEVDVKEVEKLEAEDEQGEITPGVLTKIDANNYI